MSNQQSYNMIDTIEVPKTLNMDEQGYRRDDIQVTKQGSSDRLLAQTYNSDELNESIEVPLDAPFKNTTIFKYPTFKYDATTNYKTNNLIIELEGNKIPIPVQELQQKNQEIIMNQVHRAQASNMLTIKDIYCKCRTPIFTTGQRLAGVLNVIIPGCGLAFGCCCYGCKRPNCTEVCWTGIMQFMTVTCLAGLISAWTVGFKMICN